MLTPFQEEVARLLSQLPEAAGFALAGGAALIVTGVVDRATADLDFFTQEAAAVARLAPAFETAAFAAGMTLRPVQETAGFVRVEVARGDERVEVDLGRDARLWPLQMTRVGPAVGGDELAADKTLALFGRAAARDYVDVHALAQRYGEDRLVELAAAKDLGFIPAHLADALSAIDRFDREELGVDDDQYRALRTWAARWAQSLRMPERRLDDSRGHEFDDGPDIGL